MKGLLAVLLSVIVLTSSHKTFSLENLHEYTFTDYELQFNKKYADEQEHQIRKTIFEQNVEKIKKINSEEGTWKAGINEFTDRLSHEVNAFFGKNRALLFKGARAGFKYSLYDDISDLPTSVDWREKGVLNDVRNQASCGSCWTFSVIATLEAHIAIQTGKLLPLSEQQLVDCVQNPHHCGGTGGCEGATQELGFDYVTKYGGIANRNEYKYTARDGKCVADTKTKIASIKGFTQLPVNDYNALMTAIANQGPVAISVAASAWPMYHSGIYNGDCGTTINHAVTAVGYGEENGHKYWIVRNSWGTSWGEKGHIRVHREDSAKDVVCGIDYSPADGSGCDGGPSQITVCGKCGILADSSIPYGGALA